MRHGTAALGSWIFLLLAPGTVAGLIPWWLTQWRVGESVPIGLPLRLVGVALIIAGLAVLLSAFARFVAAGGTPAPIAPTDRLVVGGLYRHVGIQCTWPF